MPGPSTYSPSIILKTQWTSTNADAWREAREMALEADLGMCVPLTGGNSSHEPTMERGPIPTHSQHGRY